MKNYPVKRGNFEHDGKHVPEGELVALTDDQAKPLLALDAIGEATDADVFTAVESQQGVAEIEGDGTGDALPPIDAEQASPPDAEQPTAAASTATRKAKGK